MLPYLEFNVSSTFIQKLRVQLQNVEIVARCNVIGTSQFGQEISRKLGNQDVSENCVTDNRIPMYFWYVWILKNQWSNQLNYTLQDQGNFFAYISQCNIGHSVQSLLGPREYPVDGRAVNETRITSATFSQDVTRWTHRQRDTKILCGCFGKVTPNTLPEKMVFLRTQH